MKVTFILPANEPISVTNVIIVTLLLILSGVAGALERSW